MTYRQWANEYKEQSNVLKQMLEELKAKRKKKNSADENKRLDNRIYMVYGMYLDCIHTLAILNERAERYELQEI